MPPATSASTQDPATLGPGHDHYIVQGRPVDLPLHVGHARAGMAIHGADAAAVAAALPADLRPVSTRPGRTLVLFMLVDYLDNPLGDYAEGIVASVVQPPAGRPGIFVHHMPVSQAFTREAGERVWGFPKTHDALDLRLSDRRAGLRWATDEGEVFELTVPRGGRLPAPVQPGCAFTHHDGTTWQTPLTFHGQGVRIGPGGGRLRLGTHPVAETLRGWSLTRRPLATAWVEHAIMDFQPAEPVRT